MSKVHHKQPSRGAHPARKTPPAAAPRAPARAPSAPPRAPAPAQRSPAHRHHADAFEPSRASAPAQRPTARAADRSEAPRREATHGRSRQSAAEQSKQRRQQVSRTIEREIERLPLPAEDRKQLERRALEPGRSAEDRRAARDLRRVIYSTRDLPRSAQAGLVKPFVDKPAGGEARSAAALTRDRNFRAASRSERELMASVFPSTSPATARGLPAVARQVSQMKLPGEQREQVLRHAFSQKSDPDVRLATRDVLRALKAQPGEAQAALLKPFTRPQLGERYAQYARDLVHSPAWNSMDATGRTQLAQVFGAASHHGLRSISLLSQQPGRLMDRDAQGGTLLSNLSQLASGPLHAGIPESRRAELLDSVLQETSRAHLVDQHRFNTCTVTSMQFELVRDNPAEFARLMAGLAGPTGRVNMQGGGELELQADALPGAAQRGRTFSEALFQSSMMEFANGTDEYHVEGPNSDESVRPDGSTYAGQFPEGMVRAVTALFGRQFGSWDTFGSNFNAQMDFLRNYRPEGPNAPVLLSYDTNGAAEGGGHAVTFVRVEGDRVFFRNPWGSNKLPPGSTQSDGSRVEDPATGLHSFTLDQLRERIWRLTVPAEFLTQSASAVG